MGRREPGTKASGELRVWDRGREPGTEASGEESAWD